jgi:N-acetylmuramoyl-L-alanine amidase
MRFTFSSLILLLTVCACSYNPYKATNKSYRRQAKALVKVIRQQPQDFDSLPFAPFWVGTTNFNLRKPNFVVIHHTAQMSCRQTLETFTMPGTEVSAHYVICKDGTIHHMLNDYLRAWHGGAGKWGNVTDLNSSSIGIELDNNGFEPFPEAQLMSLLGLLDTLKRQYSIPAANFIGHADIAPTRKKDPNIYFPWKRLSESGYGSWYADTTGLLVPAAFSNRHGLRMLGYDVTDSIAAIVAFKRHYMQDTLPVMNDSDRKVLYSLTEL